MNTNIPGAFPPKRHARLKTSLLHRCRSKVFVHFPALPATFIMGKGAKYVSAEYKAMAEAFIEATEE